MKNFKLYLTLAIMALFISSCGDKSAQVTALPAMLDSVTTVMVKSDGSLIPVRLAAEKLSPVVNDFFTASTADGVTIYKLEGDSAVEQMSGLTGAGYMACGVMPVCRVGKKIELIDSKLEVVAEVTIADGEVTECDAAFVDGFLRVTTDKGLMGLIDTKGSFRLNPDYDMLGPVCGNEILAMTETETPDGLVQKYSVVNIADGSATAIDPAYVPVTGEINNGHIVAKGPDGFGVLYVAAGEFTNFPADVRRVEEVTGGYIIFRGSNGRSGLLDITGAKLLDPLYRDLRMGPDNMAVMRDDSGWKLLNIKTNEIVSADTYFMFSGFDSKNVTMISPVMKQAFNAGFSYVVKANGKEYVIDSSHACGQSVSRINYGSLNSQKIVTDYARTTAPIELPEDEENADIAY